MYKLNFIDESSYPLASTWLDGFYQNTSMLASSIAQMVLGDGRFAVDDAVIFGGCQEADGVVSDGYIVFGGNLYKFKQSLTAQYLVLKQKQFQVTVGVTNYTPMEEYWLELSTSSTGEGVQASILWSAVRRYDLSTSWIGDADRGIGFNRLGQLEVRISATSDDTGGARHVAVLNIPEQFRNALRNFVKPCIYFGGGTSNIAINSNNIENLAEPGVLYYDSSTYALRLYRQGSNTNYFTIYDNFCLTV